MYSGFLPLGSTIEAPSLNVSDSEVATYVTKIIAFKFLLRCVSDSISFSLMREVQFAYM